MIQNSKIKFMFLDGREVQVPEAFYPLRGNYRIQAYLSFIQYNIHE